MVNGRIQPQKHHRGLGIPDKKKILIYLQELYVLLFIKTPLAVVVVLVDTLVVVAVVVVVLFDTLVVVAVQLSTTIQVFVVVYFPNVLVIYIYMQLNILEHECILFL